ncbi:unnamed protein product [Moneuplotes crassus]|uniref:EF-hand domain-containing protein n=1 Tax=Euplotes crassus TaxID=5936 RepID=A0AAD1XEX8_EUPCR|nr:unnamed protein product [Moneuplotes crassus]
MISFKQKFVTRICASYYQKAIINTPQSTPKGDLKTLRLPLGLPKELEEIKRKVLESKTFYDVLQTDEGLLALQSFLVSYQTMYLDQFTFQTMLGNILENYDEFEAIEIYDILEPSGGGVISIKEFYVFILLVAAICDEKSLECLYHHTPLIFKVISGDQKFVNKDRIESILRIVGYDEIEAQKKIDTFGFTNESLINEEDFQLLLFSIFKENASNLNEFEMTQEEIKIADEDITESMRFEEIKNKLELNSIDQSEGHGKKPIEEADFEDPFNDMHSPNEDLAGRKELTNAPLNNPDYDSNPYGTKAYCTSKGGHNLSNNTLLNKGKKSGNQKSIDPYADPQFENGASYRSKSQRSKSHISRESMHSKTEGQIQTNTQTRDETYCCGKKKCIIF